jgi:hypothetical protein
VVPEFGCLEMLGKSHTDVVDSQVSTGFANCTDTVSVCLRAPCWLRKIWHGGAESVPPLLGPQTHFRHHNCFDPFDLYHRHKNGYLGSLIRLSCVDDEFQCAIELFQK